MGRLSMCKPNWFSVICSFVLLCVCVWVFCRIDAEASKLLQKINKVKVLQVPLDEDDNEKTGKASLPSVEVFLLLIISFVVPVNLLGKTKCLNMGMLYVNMHNFFFCRARQALFNIVFNVSNNCLFNIL